MSYPNPTHDIALGVENPYHGKPPHDWAERAALGILYDLNDRRGIKRMLHNVDADVRDDLVRSMAAIIRVAHATREPTYHVYKPSTVCEILALVREGSLGVAEAERLIREHCQC